MLKVVYGFVIALILGYSAPNASEVKHTEPERQILDKIEQKPQFLPVPLKSCPGVQEGTPLEKMQQCINTKREWLHI